MKYLLACVFVGCVAGLAIEPVGRTTLDEEELLHAMEARNEAIEMELEAAEEENKNVVEAAPEERHIGGGLGVNLFGLGAGVSAGLGNRGVHFNGNAGLGNFVHYGTPAHYTQYWKQPYFPVTYNQQVESRNIGLGAGGNFGLLGAGASAGIGQGQVGFSGGFGLGGPYANYGTRNHYAQYYTNPQRVPWFNPLYLN